MEDDVPPSSSYGDAVAEGGVKVMVAISAGYSFGTGGLDNAVPFLAQTQKAIQQGLVPYASSDWNLVSQTATSMTFDFSGSAFRYGTVAKVTIYGTNFWYTHYYAGFGLDYVAGTVLNGTVQSIVIDVREGFSAGPAGGSSLVGQVVVADVSQSLQSLLETGLVLNGADYIYGGEGVGTYTSNFPPSTTVQPIYVQRLFGGAGTDTVLGGQGDDTIDGGSGADYLDGGVGSNELSFASAAGPSYAHLALGLSGDGDTLLNFRDLIGSAFNDTLAGDAQSNRLRGGAGDDVFAGGGGSDNIDGQGGNDKIFVETGPDTLSGADGFDILSFELSSFARNFTIGSLSLPDGTTLFSFEGVIGSPFADTLVGSAQIDAISGGRGADVIVLGGGTDYLNIAATDIVAGEFDYIADLQAGDFIFAPTAFPLFVFMSSGTTYAIANAPGGGYWGMGFGGGTTIATVTAAISYI